MAPARSLGIEIRLAGAVDMVHDLAKIYGRGLELQVTMIVHPAVSVDPAGYLSVTVSRCSGNFSLSCHLF